MKTINEINEMIAKEIVTASSVMSTGLVAGCIVHIVANVVKAVL
ncbi:hypothetical protein ACQCVB_17760 [Fictibacillus phosphorivorans]